MLQDKTIVCKVCKKPFVFTAAEQEFYAEKGFAHEPQRCKACRLKRRAAPQRRSYTAVCADCGQETQLPFAPKQGRPVYCDACFAKRKDQDNHF